VEIDSPIYPATKTLTTVTMYIYSDSAAGQGTRAYVLDTEIFTCIFRHSLDTYSMNRKDFEGRVGLGFSTIPGSTTLIGMFTVPNLWWQAFWGSAEC